MINKTADPSYWPKILSGLRGITNLPNNVRQLISSPGRIKFHQTTPSGADARAKAFVSTGDINDDGILDSINIVVTNLEKEWPQGMLSKINQMQDSDPAFQEVIARVAKTLIHELAHIDDHTDHNFPGGEAVAEAKENSFTPVFASRSIINENNKSNVAFVKLSANGELKMKKELIKLANHLDQIGHRDLADRLDAVLKTANELDFAVDFGAEQTDDYTGEEQPGDAEANSVAEAVVEVSGDPPVDPEADMALDEAWDAASDETDGIMVSTSEASDRIAKMAKLMSGEFTYSGGKVYRG